jgi:hypothetical protein
MQDQLEKIWKDREERRKPLKLSVGIVDGSTEMRTGYLTSSREKRYYLIKFAHSNSVRSLFKMISNK